MGTTPFVDRQEAKSGYCSRAIPRHGGYLGGAVRQVKR
jgi:hypothetical protein